MAPKPRPTDVLRAPLLVWLDAAALPVLEPEAPEPVAEPMAAVVVGYAEPLAWISNGSDVA